MNKKRQSKKSDKAQDRPPKMKAVYNGVIIERFKRLTGVPVLLNTSFNENEPIVNTPREALDCFRRTHMDVLVIGPHLLLKTENV